MSNHADIHEGFMNASRIILPRVGGGVGGGGELEVPIQDQSCNLTVGALCSCDADAHPAVSYALLGLEPIA